MSRNEAAERLRADLYDSNEDYQADLDEALATERRLTVERIEARLNEKQTRQPSTQPVRWGFLEMEIRSILKEVAADDLTTADVDEEATRA